MSIRCGFRSLSPASAEDDRVLKDVFRISELRLQFSGLKKILLRLGSEPLMFHNHERKWKILFGFVDGVPHRRSIPRRCTNFVSICTRSSVFLVPASGYSLFCSPSSTGGNRGWSPVSGAPERLRTLPIPVRPRPYLYRCFSARPDAAWWHLLVLLYGGKLDISRAFIGAFALLSLVLLIAFRLAARSFAPSISRHFGVERNVFIVGTGPRAREYVAAPRALPAAMDSKSSKHFSRPAHVKR